MREENYAAFRNRIFPRSKVQKCIHKCCICILNYALESGGFVFYASATMQWDKNKYSKFLGLDSGTNRKQYSHTKLLMKSFRNKKLCQRRAEKNQRKVEIMKSASARASYESRCVVAKDSAIIYQIVGCPWDTNICIERVYYNYIQGAPSRAYRKME